MEPDQADSMGTVGWRGAYGSRWQADPNDGSVLVFLSHNMVELPQVARGTALPRGARSPSFHALAYRHRSVQSSGIAPFALLQRTL